MGKSCIPLSVLWFSISMRPCGPGSTETMARVYLMGQLTDGALNKMGFCYKGGSVWQNSKCRHLRISAQAPKSQFATQ